MNFSWGVFGVGVWGQALAPAAEGGDGIHAGHVHLLILCSIGTWSQGKTGITGRKNTWSGSWHSKKQPGIFPIKAEKNPTKKFPVKAQDKPEIFPIIAENKPKVIHFKAQKTPLKYFLLKHKKNPLKYFLCKQKSKIFLNKVQNPLKYFFLKHKNPKIIPDKAENKPKLFPIKG